MEVHPRYPPEGNQAHRAPEVIAAVRKITSGDAEGEVDMEKQGAWACGTLLYQVTMLDMPFGGYPVMGHAKVNIEEADWARLESNVVD